MELPLVKCPLCNFTNSRFIRHDFRGGLPGMSIRKCDRCAIIFLHPQRDMTSNQYYYDIDKQRKDVLGEEFDYTNYLIRVAEDTNRRIKLCKNILLPAARILDIGCGYGAFVYQMLQLGYQVQGQDISRKRTEMVEQKFCIPIIQQPLETIDDFVIPDNNLDAITAWHVLEHVPKPQKLLSKIYRKLKPGGVAIIEVPAITDYLLYWPPYARFVYQEAHCFYYSEHTLRQVLGKAGFPTITISYIQRYSIFNALHWLIFKKPQLQNPSRTVKNRLLQLFNWCYKFIIIVFKKSDTIIAVARK
jgi:2-polyprenyl-3-methyl-5-hydroxy-6-metoxy-1,4-benzoquinol methylase